MLCVRKDFSGPGVPRTPIWERFSVTLGLVAPSWHELDLSTDPHEPEYHGDPCDIHAALAEMLSGRPSWHRQAACRGKGPGQWFPGRGESTEPARAICAECPVKADCLAAALEVGTMHDSGVWAGTSVVQRRALRRDRADEAA